MPTANKIYQNLGILLANTNERLVMHTKFPVSCKLYHIVKITFVSFVIIFQIFKLITNFIFDVSEFIQFFLEISNSTNLVLPRSKGLTLSTIS